MYEYSKNDACNGSGSEMCQRNTSKWVETPAILIASGRSKCTIYSLDWRLAGAMVEPREGAETFSCPCKRNKKIFTREELKAIYREWSKCFNAIIE